MAEPKKTVLNQKNGSKTKNGPNPPNGKVLRFRTKIAVFWYFPAEFLIYRQNFSFSGRRKSGSSGPGSEI